MKNKNAVILRSLLEHRNEELNILKISKYLQMDYKNVYLIIKRLEKLSLVRIENFGQSSRVLLLASAHPLIFEAEFERRKELLKNKNLTVMLSSIKRAIKSKLYVLLLFGSYAKRTQTKSSDLDLILICPNGLEAIFEKEISRAAHSLPLPLHPLVFSESEFIEMVKSPEPNVCHEALKQNIILYGIEQYYEMI